MYHIWNYLIKLKSLKSVLLGDIKASHATIEIDEENFVI